MCEQKQIRFGGLISQSMLVLEHQCRCHSQTGLRICADSDCTPPEAPRILPQPVLGPEAPEGARQATKLCWSPHLKQPKRTMLKSLVASLFAAPLEQKV